MQLIHDWLNALFHKNSRLFIYILSFRHLFHCVYSFSSFILDFPNSTETSRSYLIYECVIKSTFSFDACIANINSSGICSNSCVVIMNSWIITIISHWLSIIVKWSDRLRWFFRLVKWSITVLLHKLLHAVLWTVQHRFCKFECLIAC